MTVRPTIVLLAYGDPSRIRSTGAVLERAVDALVEPVELVTTGSPASIAILDRARWRAVPQGDDDASDLVPSPSAALPVPDTTPVVVVGTGEKPSTELIERALAAVRTESEVLVHPGAVVRLVADRIPLVQDLHALGSDLADLLNASRWPDFVAGSAGALRSPFGAPGGAAVVARTLATAARGVRHGVLPMPIVLVAETAGPTSVPELIPAAPIPARIEQARIGTRPSPPHPPRGWCRSMLLAVRARVRRAAPRVDPERAAPARTVDAETVRRAIVAVETPAATEELMRAGFAVEAPLSDAVVDVLADLLARALPVDATWIVTPSIGLRAADRVALELVRALAPSSPGSGPFLAVTTGDPGATRSWLLPPSVRHVPFPESAATLSEAERARVLGQLAVLLRARHVHAVESSEWDAAVSTWPSSLAAMTTTSTPDVVDVVAALVATPSFDSVVQYTAAYDDVDFDDRFPFRVLCVLSETGHAERVVEASEAARARSMPVRFDVAADGLALSAEGRTALSSGAPDAAPDYIGTLTGDLLSVRTQDYHAALVPGDDMSARLLRSQALLLGLPLLHTAGAGTDDEVRRDAVHGGSVVPPADDVLAACAALMGSRELRRTRIRTGHRVAAAVNRTDDARLLGHVTS